MAKDKQTKTPEPETKPTVEAVEAPEVVETPEVVEQAEAPKAAGPVIEYVGEGADQIEFTADPNAKHIRVNVNGLITTTY